MKRPYFNMEQRQTINLGTFSGDLMIAELAFRKYQRQFGKTFFGNFFKSKRTK